MSSLTTDSGRDLRGYDGDGSEAGTGLSTRLKLALAMAVLLVLAVVGTWVVAFSPLLGVRTVQVSGVHSLTADEVRRAAAISDGTPLVRVDAAAATSRIERLPDVQSAQVRTSMPSTVHITVVERTAVGYVQVAGRDRLVDRTGDQFRIVSAAPKQLPLLVVPVGTDARTTGGAVATVAAALPRPLLHKVRSIQALDPGAITVVLSGQRVVRWGSPARSAAKASVLQALLNLHHSRNATQFDVTDPDQPFTH